MYSNIDYPATDEKWKSTLKVLAKVSRKYGVNQKTAAKWLKGQYFTKSPDKGVHAAIARMFQAEGCLVFKKGKERTAA